MPINILHCCLKGIFFFLVQLEASLFQMNYLINLYRAINNSINISMLKLVMRHPMLISLM